MSTYLLVSDVDDTLLGDDDALDEFAAWYAKARSWLELAYASGRTPESIAESIGATRLPKPIAIIGNVGTEIVRPPHCTLLPGWPDPPASGWGADRVRQALDQLPRLRPQPPASQSDFKVSYFFDDAQPAELDEVRSILREAALEAEVIYSSNRDLDVLPRGVDKGSAVGFLADALEIPRERVLTSGNSANDAALFRAPFRGIVVANAHDELKAMSGEYVYLSRRNHAGGVLEGLWHWFGSEDPEASPS